MIVMSQDTNLKPLLLVKFFIVEEVIRQVHSDENRDIHKLINNRNDTLKEMISCL
jgi:hypothetical protein